jgi:hypothetical protein
MMLMVLDTEQGVFIICASIVEALRTRRPVQPQHRSRMTTTFVASTSAQPLHRGVHARCSKALVVWPAPGGIVDG